MYNQADRMRTWLGRPVHANGVLPGARMYVHPQVP